MTVLGSGGSDVSMSLQQQCCKGVDDGIVMATLHLLWCAGGASIAGKWSFICFSAMKLQQCCVNGCIVLIAKGA